MRLVILTLLPGRARSAPLATYWRGVEVHSLQVSESDAQMVEDLDYAQAAGANVVRVDIGWATLEENGPGQFTPWYSERLAAFMGAAAARGLKVIAILFSTPCWASSAPDSLKQGCEGDWWDAGVGWYPPANVQNYANFVRYITSQYGSELAAVEIWNEPDQPQSEYWKSTNAAADYARLLHAAYPAAKQGDPKVPVLAGSLAGSDVSFLQALYADGIGGYYDGIAVHPYSGANAPEASPAGGDVRFETAAGLQAIHALQLQHGDHTQLWVTEFGWNTVGNTAAQQASYIARGYQIFAWMPYVRAALVYELHDDIGGGVADPEAHFGLLGSDYTQKPAYSVFAAVMKAPAAPVLTARLVARSSAPAAPACRSRRCLVRL